MVAKLTGKFQQNYQKTSSPDITIDKYLELCKTDPMAYATAAERMLDAIGTPRIMNTRDNPRMSRIFQNRKVPVYDAFKDFYGMEEVIENLVAYFKHAAQGLEEKKQVLYLLGPVGGGKSSLAERIKELMEKNPIYILVDADGNPSPNFESPLGLFDPREFGDTLEEEYNIPKRYLTGLMGPWTQKRLEEYEGDISKFQVRKIFPSKLRQHAIAKTEPGDENNQDISSLVGKTDIRKLEDFSQNDADAYSYSGGLCLANQGLLEFVEMFKAPIKVLHPLLTATQEGNFMGTEGLAAIPFQGLILAHSNESEWETFRNNKNNEAFLDRVYIVRVPYCLRIKEEELIYEKLIENSSLSLETCAPYTLSMLAQLCVLSRLEETENSSTYAKMRVYNGDNVKDTDPSCKSIEEYKSSASIDEGMNGLSTRYAYKILSRVYNLDDEEIAANPVHLLYVLQRSIKNGDFDTATQERLLNYVKSVLQANYKEAIGKEIQMAYMESHNDYGQNIFEKYINYAESWLDDSDYLDPQVGTKYDKAQLNAECEKIEVKAGITNAKDFRNELVRYTLKYKSDHGKFPSWKEYEKIRDVIEQHMFTNTEELLPIISFDAKSSSEENTKHDEFVQRMVKHGYTRKQVQIVVDWYIRVQKNA